jgi:peptide chain release factor
MSIKKETWDKLYKKLEALNILEEEILERFIRGSGKGGQKINKTDSCVYLKYLPMHIEIKCQESRSREENRYHARQRLLEMVEEIVLEKESKKQKEIHKIRQQKKRRSRKAQQKMLEDKSHRAAVKTLRQPDKGVDN